MTNISVMSSLVLVLAVLAGLCLSTAKAQTINPCDDSVDAVQPFIYNISDLHETICPNPPTPGSQDVLLCTPAPAPASGYVVTAPEQGVPRPEICLMMNPTSCVRVIEGESVGILIQLSNFSMTERLEIEILVDLNVFFGIGSRPLQIVSGKNLSIPGSLVIAERVIGVFLLTKVCEILVNGTIINSEFTTNPGRSDCLKAAVGSQHIDSGVAQSITLIPPQASSEQRIATLFLISNFETCSPTVKKLSNVFTVNITINQTTTLGTTSPPTGATDPLPTQGGTELGVIIGGVVGAVAFSLLLTMVVMAIIVCLVCRLRSPPRIDFENHTDGTTNYGHNGTVIVAWDYNDPWYLKLKETLGKNFHSGMEELVLTENFEINNILVSPQVHHLLLIENVDEANHHSFYSSCLEKFIGSIDSGVFDVVSKVWYIQLGVHEEFDTHSAIHRLGITQSKSSMTGEECAHAIHEQIYSYDLKHSSDSHEKLLEYLEETAKRTLSLVENFTELKEGETLVIPDDAEEPNTES